jgi:hypothetical protein
MAAYSLANQAGALFRAALNTVLGKLQRNYAGTTDPASVSESVPGMFWIDATSTPTLKIRNAADSAWISAFSISTVAQWLGSVSTSALTSTGGNIDGTVIGATTPAAATFTGVTAPSFTATGAAAASMDYIATNEADTHERTRLDRNGADFRVTTRNNGGTLVAVDYAMTVGASGATQHAFRVTGTERLRVQSSGIVVTGSVNAGAGLTIGGPTLPDTSGVRDIGSSTLGRFATIFLANSPNVSSDARLKSDIGDLTDAERRAAARMKTRTFTMIATGQRKVGYVAQEIIAAMQAEGLDAFAYGLVSDGETYGVDMDAINAFRLG